MLNKSCKINFVNENDFKRLVYKYTAIDMLVYIYIYIYIGLGKSWFTVHLESNTVINKYNTRINCFIDSQL